MINIRGFFNFKFELVLFEADLVEGFEVNDILVHNEHPQGEIEHVDQNFNASVILGFTVLRFSALVDLGIKMV